MAVIPTAITPLPTPPTTADPANFDVRADAFLGALPAMVTQINSSNATSYNNAVEAAQGANSATAAKTAAETASSQANTAKTGAESAATQAGAARDGAVAANTDLQKYYLGYKTTPPTTNNQGGALMQGCWYTNSNGSWYWWNGSTWTIGVGNIAGSFLPLTGGTMTGPITLSAGPAQSNQVPRLFDVVPRTVSYYGSDVAMAFAPPGTVCFFEASGEGGVDWPYRTSVSIHSWMVETWDRGGSRSTQTATFTLSGFAATGSKFVRYKHDAAWSPWSRVISSKNFIEDVVNITTTGNTTGSNPINLNTGNGTLFCVKVRHNTVFAPVFQGYGDQCTLRLEYDSGVFPISFTSNIKLPNAPWPTLTNNQIFTVVLQYTRPAYVDLFYSGIHNSL